MPKTLKKSADKKAKKSVGKGSRLSCKECGMLIEVVDPCGCSDSYDISCCGEPMVLISG